MPGNHDRLVFDLYRIRYCPLPFARRRHQPQSHWLRIVSCGPRVAAISGYMDLGQEFVSLSIQAFQET